MPENDLKTIQVNIAGRNFPIQVTTQEENIVRDLEQELNEKVSHFKTTYPSRDKLDCVLMTLITYTFDQKQSSKSADLTPVIQQILDIKGLFEEE